MKSRSDAFAMALEVSAEVLNAETVRKPLLTMKFPFCFGNGPERKKCELA